MRESKKGLVAALLLTLCLFASGCSFNIAASPDELYYLPQLPQQYTELESKINEILQNGGEYAAPTSGANLQPVQLVDLNGDGNEEAVAFFRKSTDEKPLKIYIFSPENGSYTQTAVIEGSGSSIYSVAYSDLNQDGRMELIVGWKVGAELQALSVYSLREAEPEELVRTPYVRYAVTNLDAETAQQALVILHADGEGNSLADYYTWKGDTLSLTSSARLSMTMADLSAGRVFTGTLEGGIPALFVTGVGDSSVAITDILAERKGELTNLVLSDSTGVSTEVYRYMTLFPMDINGDGITEVPAPVELPGQSDPNVDAGYRVDWKAYKQRGQGETVLSTYHDIDDGWYLKLPSAWVGRITVLRAQSGVDEMAVTFSYLDGDGETPRNFLRIYTITGDSREYKAVRGARFILSRQAETIYAAELLEGNSQWDGGITEDDLRASFNLITNEWLAGNS